jgi:hypothetical protein
MGGNALKQYGVERLTKEQYDEVLSALIITLPYKTVAIPSYRAKDSFGDCDLLTTATDEAFENSLSKDFTLLGKKKNGSVTSYALKYGSFPPFQFDLIKAKEESFKFNYNYLSYNDLGNLIGRVAAAFGFKFAHNGLYLLAWYSHKGEERSVARVKENGKTNDHAEYKMEKLFISNFDQALEFLGFDSLRFAQGFDTIDNILDFVASSKYFCKDFFLFENRNHDQRKRDVKRPTYTRALEYFDTLVETKSRDEVTKAFKVDVAKKYPSIINIKRDMCKEIKRKYIFSRRLSSRRVVWLYRRLFNKQLEGVALGGMMKFLNNNCDKTLAVSGVSNYQWYEHLAQLMRMANSSQFQQSSMCG